LLGWTHSSELFLSSFLGDDWASVTANAARGSLGCTRRRARSSGTRGEWSGGGGVDGGQQSGARQQSGGPARLLTKYRGFGSVSILAARSRHGGALAAQRACPCLARPRRPAGLATRGLATARSRRTVGRQGGTVGIHIQDAAAREVRPGVVVSREVRPDESRPGVWPADPLREGGRGGLVRRGLVWW
jgi:hypothetical protein